MGRSEYERGFDDGMYDAEETFVRKLENHLKAAEKARAEVDPKGTDSAWSRFDGKATVLKKLLEGYQT